MQLQIFLIYSCDEWCSTDSLRLICATTSPSVVRNVIVNEIENDGMYYDSSELTREEMIEMFKEDWDKKDRGYINGKLSFGYYDYTMDGDLI